MPSKISIVFMTRVLKDAETLLCCYESLFQEENVLKHDAARISDFGFPVKIH